VLLNALKCSFHVKTSYKCSLFVKKKKAVSTALNKLIVYKVIMVYYENIWTKYSVF